MVDWTWTNGGIAFCLVFVCIKMLWFLERIAEATERLAQLRSPVPMFRNNPLAFKLIEEQARQPPMPSQYPGYQQPPQQQ